MTDKKYSLHNRISLHEELTTHKALNTQYKFPYQERIAKETCLNQLITYDFPAFEKETNKEKLKEIKAKKEALMEKIREKCIRLYHKNKEAEHLANKKEDLLVQNKQLKLDLAKLETEFNNKVSERNEREIIKNNLLRIEDKINEREKLENLNSDDVERLLRIYNEKQMIYKNYMNGLDENTCDILQQERHYMYNKGLKFLQSISGFSIQSCKMVNDRIRIHVEASSFSICIIISDNKLHDIEILDIKCPRDGIEEVVRHCIVQNNPMYLFCHFYKQTNK